MALPRTYDHIFSRHRGVLPLNYVRALSQRESNLNPKSGGGTYWGLLQVGYTNVLPSYNKRHGTSYSAQDLFDPDVNVKIATDLLNRIVIAYSKHPHWNMRENWRNPEFVKLVTAGWNSGYSEAAGVGKVASWLESNSIPVTHDNVFRYAGAAGGTKHLSNTAKQRWQRSVSDLFYAEGGPGGASTIVKLAITVAVSWAVYRYLLN